jgi:ribonuclease G
MRRWSTSARSGPVFCRCAATRPTKVRAWSCRCGARRSAAKARCCLHGSPAQLDPAPGFAAALAARLPGTPERIWVDDTAPLRELRDAFPDAEIAHGAPVDWPLDLDAVFEAALAPSVALPGGGAIHIEDARAAVLIDVDTGTPESGSAQRTALAANLAAAQAIARQLRLRQLGGGIVVDFAALEGRGPRERVRGAVAAALAADPAEPRLLGWTRLGHLELVRPRRFRSLGEAMLEPGGWRRNAASLAFAALRALYREARANPARSWRLVVLADVEAALRGPAAAALRGLEARLGRAVALEIASGRDAEPFDIAAV